MEYSAVREQLGHPETPHRFVTHMCRIWRFTLEVLLYRSMM